jgi:inorganic triphosphatase YgiF
MIESELKIALDAKEMARLRRHPALAAMRLAPRRTERLVSVYYDTPDQALAAAGVSLRLRRVGRAWVQTIKRRAGGTASGGFFAHRESERAAPGGRLVLDGADDDGAIAEVAEVSGGAPLSPVFETRVRRLVEQLAAPGGGAVELALDEGEIVAGEAREPIREAEIELKDGEVEAVFALARTLFDRGPVRFAALNKAARGYALARREAAEGPAPRRAGTLKVDAQATVETVARDVLRDCLGQIADNAVVVAESEDPEGPHQLRVGLRRLRTAFAVFGPSLGAEAMVPLNAAARELGRLVGRLRDADVLIAEVVEPAAALGLDPAARAALVAALEARRDAVRAEVRAGLAAPEAVGFLFDLGRFIEARGWLVPSDYGQTERLAMPVAEAAPAMLDKRHRRVRKAGKRIRKLDAEGLHELRKELKKLRYAVEMLGPIYPGEAVGPYLKPLKELQDSFGSLNDAAMAEASLTGPEAPGASDPAAQRAVGWVLGTLVVKVADDRPKLFERWDRLHDAEPFWR